MPRIFDKDGFVIYFYGSERNERHHLTHVHIYKARFGGDSMIVTIPQLEILESDMNSRDEKKALQILTENLEEIAAATK
jgi:hypothetical protein